MNHLAHQSDVELKPLAITDAAVLSAVATQAYLDHYAETWYDNGAWYIQTYFNVARLQQELADEHARFFFIYYNNTPAGFIKLNLDKPLSDETNALELERIYLVKSASGKGIGTFVMNFIFDVARAQHKKMIWLKAMDTNDGAIRFYEKSGFEICGTHEVTFPQKKEGMRGMYIMRKQV